MFNWRGLFLGPESQLIGTTRGIYSICVKKANRNRDEKNEGTRLIKRILKLLRHTYAWWSRGSRLCCCFLIYLLFAKFALFMRFQQSEIWYKHVLRGHFFNMTAHVKNVCFFFTVNNFHGKKYWRTCQKVASWQWHVTCSQVLTRGGVYFIFLVMCFLKRFKNRALKCNWHLKARSDK